MKKSLLPLMAATLILTGCENPMKTTSQMNITTTEMNDTTKKMAQTTSDMKSTTEGMAEVTNDMSKNVKHTDKTSTDLKITAVQGGTSETRDKEFERVLLEKEFVAKTDYAAKFMFALEFQVFTDPMYKPYDGEDMLEAKRGEGMLEIAKKCGPLISKQMKASLETEAPPKGFFGKLGRFFRNLVFKPGFSGLEKDNDAQSFFAMSAALHKVNSDQEQFRKAMGLETESALDIIFDGLRAKHEKMEDLSLSQKEVLREEQTFTLMIEARHKFLPLIAIARMSHIEKNLFQKIKMLKKKWKPTFLDEKNYLPMNAAQIFYLSDILDKALESKDFLKKELDIDSRLDKKVIKILSKLDLDIPEKLKGKIDSQQVAAINKLKVRVNMLLEEKKERPVDDVPTDDEGEDDENDKENDKE